MRAGAQPQAQASTLSSVKEAKAQLRVTRSRYTHIRHNDTLLLTSVTTSSTDAICILVTASDFAVCVTLTRARAPPRARRPHRRVARVSGLAHTLRTLRTRVAPGGGRAQAAVILHVCVRRSVCVYRSSWETRATWTRRVVTVCVSVSGGTTLDCYARERDELTVGACESGESVPPTRRCAAPSAQASTRVQAARTSPPPSAPASPSSLCPTALQTSPSR